MDNYNFQLEQSVIFLTVMFIGLKDINFIIIKLYKF